MVELIRQYHLIFALSLDLIIGDPLWFPHPVKIIGFYVDFLENYLRKIFPKNLKSAGIALNMLVVIPTFFITYLMIKTATAFSPILGITAEVIIIFTSLSTRSLIIAGRQVLAPLKLNRLAQARSALQEIVSRDTSRQNENQIMKGVLETTAENTSDGIISPLFFAALGGAPLAMAYKAINTLDSMVGYKNEKYRDLGWFSARTDDIANFIPARITGFLIFSAGIITFKHPLICARAMWRDSQKGPSPNSGIPISGFAGVLNIQLGGPSRSKDGSINNIPYVGGIRKELKSSDFSSASVIVILLPILFLIGYYLLRSLILT